MRGPWIRQRPAGEHVTNKLIGEILRGVARARAAAGDDAGARLAARGARAITRKEGPGEPYRKHVRTSAPMPSSWERSR